MARKSRASERSAKKSLSYAERSRYCEEMDCQRRARLKDFSIHASVEELKGREQEELAEALKIYGEKVDDGFEYHFEGECPIVAAYSYDEPCDVVVGR